MKISNKFWNGKVTGIFSAFVLGCSILSSKIINKITTFLFINNLNDHGSNIKIYKGLTYRYPNSIQLGNNVIIAKNTSLTSEGLKGHYLIIEDEVSIGNNCEIDFTGGITIHKSAHLAHSILISTHDHGYDYKNRPIGKSLDIGENAFIGSKSIIMHNCNYIGKNAVVGTGSLVTKDVPDYAIVAGNPAKIIKYINEKES